MNIFHKVALQGLLKNRARTLVTIIGVALSAALFTAVAAFGTSLVHYMANAEIKKGGNWHVMFSGLSPSEKQARMEDTEVADAAVYEDVGYAVLEGAGKQSADRPYLFIAGFEEETFEALPISLICGRLPENSGEILVPSDSIAIKAGVRISVNDTLTLAVGERESGGKKLTQCDPLTETESLVHTEEKTYTVVGTFEKPGFELSSPGYTLVTRADGEGQAGSYSLFIALKDPHQVYDYAESKKGGSGYGINENLLRFMGISDNKIFNTFLYTIGGVLAAIIMTGSVFLIYNAFYISLNERVRQYGILMSVGAAAKQLLSSVLFEGFCIGLVGVPLGMIAGICCIALCLPAVEKSLMSAIMFYDEPLTLSVSFPALAASAVVSFITILLSAYIPARKAVSTPVMDCLRQTGEIKTEEKAVRISKTAGKLCGLEGVLALKNFRRNKKRYRSIVLSLTLSVVLAVTGSAFSTVLKQAGSEYTGEMGDGDISFVTQDMQEEEFIRFYDRLKGTEGIDRSTWQADYIYPAATDDLPDDFLAGYRSATGDGSTGKKQRVTLYTQFIEDDIYYDFLEELGLSAKEYSGEDAKVLVCGMNAKEHTTYFAGSSMNFTLTSSSGEPARTLCATFADTYPLDTAFVLEEDVIYAFIVTAPLSVKPQFDGVETADGRAHLGALFWTGTPTQTMRQIQAALLEEGIMSDYQLINLAQAFEIFRSTGFVVDIFTYIFTLMISLIAVANVFNTISTNIRLRRRELAMLRSVGMSDRAFRKMMNFECAFYGIYTLLFGVPVSLALSYLIHKVILSAERMDDIAFAMPWGALGISVSGVFCIVFITMLYATGKIRKENIIDALRDEMM